jgi:hypothetical protein
MLIIACRSQLIPNDVFVAPHLIRLWHFADVLIDDHRLFCPFAKNRANGLGVLQRYRAQSGLGEILSPG